MAEEKSSRSEATRDRYRKLIVERRSRCRRLFLVSAKGKPGAEMEESMMSESKSISKRWRSPVVLIRLSSILFVGEMIGHMSAYPWTSAQDPREAKLVVLMKEIPFVFVGERSTYWNLYFGWGLLVGVLLLTLAIILWILSDLAHIGSRGVGAISGIVSATSLLGAYLSFRFFYIPPFLLFSAICVSLMTAAVQLLRRQNTD